MCVKADGSCIGEEEKSLGAMPKVIHAYINKASETTLWNIRRKPSASRILNR
jgi:hypothetical protein